MGVMSLLQDGETDMAYYNGSMHGKHCNSRSWETSCKYCGLKIFYFTCDHGIKVFFDKRGKPWPVHNCRKFKLVLELPDGYIIDGDSEKTIKVSPDKLLNNTAKINFVIELKKHTVEI